MSHATRDLPIIMERFVYGPGSCGITIPHMTGKPMRHLKIVTKKVQSRTNS